jgi:hypothetical protein
VSEQPPDYEKLAEQIAQLPVDDILVGTASTLASIAYAKLGAGDRGEAKRAIDALATIVGLIDDEAVRKDLTAALTNVQVAFASQV